ncbi:MAG: helix-turn-helix domain-containing protein [Magnetococcales bacterium]|nr:helix-turn-helix domain-containing protein [Magnetococcales bacterium]
MISRILGVYGAKNESHLASILKMSKGTVSGWKRRGNVPHDFCARIATEQGASSDWLLTGKGSPFIGGYFASEEEAISHLDILLDESGWNLYLVSDRTSAYCLVLTQDHESESADGVKKSYTEVEIIGGQVGENLLERVSQLTGQVTAFTVDTTAEEVKRLVNGQVGSHEIMGRDGEGNGLPDRAISVVNFSDFKKGWLLPHIKQSTSDQSKDGLNGTTAQGMKNYPEVGAEDIFRAMDQLAKLMEKEGKVMQPGKMSSMVRLTAEILADEVRKSGNDPAKRDTVIMDKIRQIIRIADK